MAQGYKRLTIDLGPELYEELEQSARERGIEVPELIRRAVALDRYVWSHREPPEDPTIREELADRLRLLGSGWPKVRGAGA